MDGSGQPPSTLYVIAEFPWSATLVIGRVTRPIVSEFVSTITNQLVMFKGRVRHSKDLPHVVEKARLLFPFDLAPHWSAAGFWVGCAPAVVLGFGAGVFGFGAGVLGLGAGGVFGL